MTEAEWLTTTDLGALQSGLTPSRVSDRKVRLFRAACCRSLWGDLTLRAAREAVEAAERFADRLVSAGQLGRVNAQGFVRFEVYCRRRNLRRAGRDPQLRRRLGLAAFAIDTTSADAGALFPIRPDSTALPGVERVAPALLRDVFGSPFRRPAFDPRWQTDDVLGLARGIYEERAFDRMPLLADALMDAGCNDPEVLAHCRSDGPHVRGCWAVDLVLGEP